jgi:L-threonylcarbamoyladenylate synthase
LSSTYPIRWSWSDSLDPLIRLLDEGGLVGFPTESSYAIGADPRDIRGVKAIFKVKRRVPDKPLPVVLGSLDQLVQLGGDPDHTVLRQIARLWPAPLTVVVPINQPIPAAAMMDSLAIRIPAHHKLRDLLVRLGRPLASTSANLSGDKPVSNPEMLKPILRNRPSLIIDDGILPGGSPSTIVKIETDGVVVLRQGAYPADRLAEALSTPVFSAAAAEISADDSLETR